MKRLPQDGQHGSEGYVKSVKIDVSESGNEVACSRQDPLKPGV